MASPLTGGRPSHGCAGKRTDDLLFPSLDGGYLRAVHGPGKGWF